MCTLKNTITNEIPNLKYNCHIVVDKSKRHKYGDYHIYTLWRALRKLKA